MTRSSPREALALGTVGSLGDELLSALVASPDYRIVHVAMNRSIASSSPKYHPWPIGTSIPAIDDAFLCLCGPDTLVPRNSPLVAYDVSRVVEAAGVARQADARRLIVVAPLSALLQMNAAALTV